MEWLFCEALIVWHFVERVLQEKTDWLGKKDRSFSAAVLKPVPLASLSALPLFATMMLAGILAWCETTKHGRPHAYLRFPIALYQHVSQRRARNTSYKLDMKCSFWQVFQAEFPESLVSDSKGRDSRYKTRNRTRIGLEIWGFPVSDSESDSRIWDVLNNLDLSPSICPFL